MSIRIYALAKQFKIDSLVVLNVTKTIGITAQSAHASLTEEEAHKVKEELLRQQQTLRNVEYIKPVEKKVNESESFHTINSSAITTANLRELNLLRNSRVVVDTCFAMNSSEFTVFLDTYKDIFQENKVIIPVKVYEELLEIVARPNENPVKVAKANQAMVTITQKQKEGVIQFRQAEGGADNLSKIADQVIYLAVQILLLSDDVLVCTKDKGLTQDLYNLVGLESYSFKHKLHVLKQYKNGKLNFARHGGYNAKPKTATPLNTLHGLQPFTVVSEPVPSHQQPLTVDGKLEKLSAGSTIYTQERQPIVLRSKVGEGGEGTIFSTNDDTIVAKLYFKERLTRGTQEKIELMVSRKIPDPQICWPQTPLYDIRGIFRGFLMPKATGKPLGHGLFIPIPWLEQNPLWTRYSSVKLVLSILEKIRLLHRINVILGDINPLNILIDNESHVYFVDCDSYQVEGYPCSVGTVNFTPPEIQGKDYSDFLRSEHDELFAVATLLFMIMLPGKAPYSHEGGGNGAENIRKGHFPYCLGERNSVGVPLGRWRFCWSHLSRPIKEAFNHSFHIEHRGKPRISLGKWICLFGKYLSVLSDSRNVFMGPTPDYGFDMSILPESKYYCTSINPLPEDGMTGIQRLKEREKRNIRRLNLIPHTNIARRGIEKNNTAITGRSLIKSTPPKVSPKLHYPYINTVVTPQVKKEWLVVQPSYQSDFKDIFEAAKQGTVQNVKCFVENGVDVNAKNKIGWTPLHCAAWYNSNVRVLEYLVFQGACVNEKDFRGWIPLHCAACNNPNVEVLIYLVSLPRVDVNIRNNTGLTSMDLADTEEKKCVLREAMMRESGSPAVVKSLSSFQYSPFKDIFEAAKQGTVQNVKYFVENGVDVNAKANSDWIPLHCAAWNNSNVEVFKYLVSLGSDVSAKDNAGWTPLHYAARFNPNVEVLMYLISQRVDVNAKTNSDQTSLDIANTEEKKRILREAMGLPE